jgi:hypothetical protein
MADKAPPPMMIAGQQRNDRRADLAITTSQNDKAWWRENLRAQREKGNFKAKESEPKNG